MRIACEYDPNVRMGRDRTDLLCVFLLALEESGRLVRVDIGSGEQQDRCQALREQPQPRERSRYPDSGDIRG
jgi:hypothetical protein